LKKTFALVLIFQFIFIAAISAGNKSPLFIENKNQWDKKVLFKSEIPGGVLWLEQNKFTYGFYDQNQIHEIFHGHENQTDKVDMHGISVEFLNANTEKVFAEKPKDFAYNYFVGSDKSQWASNAKLFESVWYKNIYSNIDLNVYSFQNTIKYDFYIAPQSDPNQIKFNISGANKVSLKNGDLHIKTSISTLIEKKPIAWQIINGEKKYVSCDFSLKNNIVSFRLGEYDKNEALTIDPILVFSTFSGAFSDNWGFTATYDNFGFLYSGSIAFAAGYPLLGPYQSLFGGQIDVCLTKYDTTGQSIIYSTFLGGSQCEFPHSIIANSNDELFIYGTTSSNNFPTTSNAFDQSFNGGTPINFPYALYTNPNGFDIFVSKLSVNGNNLLGSTYLGGSANDGLNTSFLKQNYADEARGEISIDLNDNIYIASCTFSSNFPIIGGFQSSYGGMSDGIVVKMDNQLSSVIWSSYIGGNNHDAVYSLALDNLNNVIVCGGTLSPNLSTSVGVVQPVIAGNVDAFVSKISGSGNQILRSTYWGSSALDQAYFVETDKENNIYLLGQTAADSLLMVQNVNYFIPKGTTFISKFNPNLDSVLFSTRVGTTSINNKITPSAFLVDACKKIYFSGWGGGTNGGNISGLPITTNSVQQTTDGQDFYIMLLEDDISAIYYAGYFGSPTIGDHVDGGTSRFDRKGKIYQSVCAGCTGADNFPTTANAYSNTNNSTNCNNAVFKIDMQLPIVVAEFQQPPINCAPYAVQFINTSTHAPGTQYQWYFGDGASSTAMNPSHTYLLPGTYNIKLVVTDTNACNYADSITKQLIVISGSSQTLASPSICLGNSIQIGILPSGTIGLVFNWLADSTLSDLTISNPVANPSTTTQYTLLISNGNCSDTIRQTVNVVDLQFGLAQDTAICSPNVVLNLFPQHQNSANQFHWSSSLQFADMINSSFQDSVITINVVNSRTYYLEISDSVCTRIDSIRVNYNPFEIALAVDSICLGDTALIVAGNLIPNANLNYVWQTNQGNIISQNDSAWIITDTISVINLSVSNVDGCTKNYQAELYVKPFLVDFVTDSITCTDLSVELTGIITAPGAYTLLWNFGDGNTAIGNPYIHTYLNPNYYQVNLTVIDSNICKKSISITKDILFLSNEKKLFDTTQVCLNDTILIGLNVNPIGINFQWLPNGYIANPNLPYTEVYSTQNTNFILLATDGTCTDTLVYHYQIFPIEIETSNDTTLCFPSSVTLNVNAFGNGQQYFWSDNVNFNNILGNDSFLVYTPQQSMQLYVKAENGICSDIDSIQINYFPVETILKDTNICFQDTVMLEVFSAIPNQTLTYNWQNDNSIINIFENTALVAPTESKWFKVEVTNAEGCSVFDSALVNVSNLRNDLVFLSSSEDTIVQTETIILKAQPDGYNYLWQPSLLFQNPNLQEQTLLLNQNTYISVIVFDDFGCSFERSIPITVYELVCEAPYIFIPNSFTPNNDGNNDVLRVRGRIVEKMYLAIYNRWGEMVFETNNQNTGWDGNYKGRTADPGVFTYYLKGNCIDGQEFLQKGNITLLR